MSICKQKLNITQLKINSPVRIERIYDFTILLFENKYLLKFGLNC